MAFCNACGTSLRGDGYSLVSTVRNKIVTIKTLIKVANVSGKGVTGASSD